MVKVVVGMMGSSPFSISAGLGTAAQFSDFLSVVSKHPIVKELDTARIYGKGTSESFLGEVDASSKFVISTKAPGHTPGSLEYEKVIANCNASLAALKVDKVDIFYIHGPDRQTPLEEQCRAFNDLYKQGKFKRFGVSSLSDAEVQQAYDICEKNGWVKPTVYQGGYNIFGRGGEKTLFPLLRKLGMAFYAFGPQASGLLVKPIEEIINPTPGSHFAELPFLKTLYLQEHFVSALKQFKATCDAAGTTTMETALRWMRHHSVLGSEDAIILGAGNKEHIDGSLTAIEKGPLSEDLVKAVEAVWDQIKENPPPYHV